MSIETHKWSDKDITVEVEDDDEFFRKGDLFFGGFSNECIGAYINKDDAKVIARHFGLSEIEPGIRINAPSKLTVIGSKVQSDNSPGIYLPHKKGFKWIGCKEGIVQIPIGDYKAGFED